MSGLVHRVEPGAAEFAAGLGIEVKARCGRWVARRLTAEEMATRRTCSRCIRATPKQHMVDEEVIERMIRVGDDLATKQIPAMCGRKVRAAESLPLAEPDDVRGVCRSCDAAMLRQIERDEQWRAELAARRAREEANRA